MADRVHPDPVQSPSTTDTGNQGSTDADDRESQPQKPKAGTYVIQIPKDQIYRVPPPQNAHLFESYTRRGARRRRPSSPCCRCVVLSVSVLLLLAFAVAVASGVLYFVFRPRLPSYSLDRIVVRGFNFSRAALSPEIDLTVRADNPNRKMGLEYLDGGDVSASHSGATLCRGSWPAFRQGRRNATVFEIPLRGTGIRLSSSSRSELLDQERKGEVPLEIDVRVPVKIKFGAVTSWKIDVKVGCDVVVDKLTGNARIASRKCRTKVDF